MIAYKVKARKLSGTSYAEMVKQARLTLKIIEKRTKRRPYVRSAYFNREKIFFDYYWSHLLEKSHRERVRRLRYLPCAMELIEKSRNAPAVKQSTTKKTEVLYRFMGITSDNEAFYVQIKENSKTEMKYLMSTFPPE